MIRNFYSLMFCVFIFDALTSLKAQHLNTGQISGCVKNNLLQPIVGTKITIHRQESGVVSRAVSDRFGIYHFSGLIAGQYELIAESTSFRSTRVGGISVHAGQTSVVDVQLTVDGDRDVLHVHDRASLLKTSSSGIDDVVPERPLAELPLNNRHFLQLSLLSDGVVRPPGGTRGSALQQAEDLVNVAGQRSGHVLKNWQIAGIFTAQTGAPFTVNLGTDHANIGPGPSQRPDALQDPNAFSNRTPERWFDISAFTLPAPFTLGNLGRNTVFAPGEVSFDTSLKKTFILPRESTRLLFQVDVFNAIIRPNFGGAKPYGLHSKFWKDLQHSRCPLDSVRSEVYLLRSSP